MKKTLVKVIAGVGILAIGCYATYTATVNAMFKTANARAANAFAYGKTQGYDYAVKTARLTFESGNEYIITFGKDDGNRYKR